MLGTADKIVVTQDSMSMVSDAMATGKPVYLSEAGAYFTGSVGKLYNEALQKQGALLPMSQLGEPAPATVAVNSAEAIAQSIRKKLLHLRSQEMLDSAQYASDGSIAEMAVSMPEKTIETAAIQGKITSASLEKQ